MLLLLIGVASACNLTGDWSKGTYIAGEKMRFHGVIDPAGGFIHGYVYNPYGDIIAELPSTQTQHSFNFTIQTNSSFFNGTYSAHLYYDKLANGSNCGKSLSATANLITNNTGKNIEFEVLLRTSYNHTMTEKQGAPVETPIGTIETTLRGYGVPGLLPSFNLLGTKLVQGEGIGNITINLNVCQRNKDIINSYNQIATFLRSNFTNMVAYEKQIENMKNLLSEKNDKLKNMTGQYFKAENELKKVLNREAGKIEYIWAFFIFTPIGMLLLILIQNYNRKVIQEKKKRPLPLKTEK